MCKFTQKELISILNELKRKDWLNEDFVNNQEFFIDKVCNLKFTSPQKEDVFNAFKIGENNEIIKPEDVRVLIIGQDPYPEEGKAHGYAFSVLQSYTDKHGVDDSLQNIFKAIKNYHENCNIEKSSIEKWNTNLEIWAKNNGVLLLNTALTYKSGEKHFNIWKPFVTEIICNLIKNKPDNDNNNKLACFLWGVPAQNIFTQSLNLLDDENKNQYFNIDCIKDLRCRKKRQFKKINILIRKEYKIKDKLRLYLTSHPSNNWQAVKKGFSDDAPGHFKACDEFLFREDEKQYIWKNFPENNQEKQK